MVLVPRAELEALRAENRCLRREAGDREALRRIRSDSGDASLPGQDLGRARGTTATTSDAAHQAIFHLLEEPVPTLADPFPEDDPVTKSQDGQVVIVVQHIKADT
jgi:hypothetical protein